MPKSKSPIVRLIPSSGKRLKEVSENLDFLTVIISVLIPAILAEHPYLKKTILRDLKAIRDSAVWRPDTNLAFNKAIKLFEKMLVVPARKK